MEKHWHWFAGAVALWTLAFAGLVSATMNGRLVLAAWSVMAALLATCVTLLVVVRLERMKLEGFAHGLARQMAKWTAEQLADAEVPRVPRRQQ